MFKNKKTFIAFVLTLIIIFTNCNILFAQTDEIQKDFEINFGIVEDEITNGFKKIKSEFVSDYQTNAYTYEHIKTGAKVLVINNSDSEKFFTIGFKTPPYNNSGATHVFEHTTLQGSKSYPIKSILTKLGSTSMATYFNAATADDFTFYPFGSLNEKDYYNLMNVYLDGIFNPLVTEDKNVFKRDGFRVDLIDGQLMYNGVVFNEMKNSSTNVNSILYNSIKQSLYPDTYYKYVSGGVPEDITDLTYEQIVEIHSKAYHPSNSLTILYGEQDLNKSLQILNNYFKDFDKRDDEIGIGYQVPYTELKKYYTTYPANENDKSIMALSYVMPQNNDYEKTMIYLILLDLLMSSDTAPLKIAMGEAGITNSLGVTSNYVQVNQGAITFYSMNIDADYEDIFIQVIENALKKVKENGFDKKYIEAIFNAYEYSQYASSNTKNRGYNAGIYALSGWIYHNDPTRMLDNRAICAKLKKQLNSEMFENAIDELFLNNNYKALAVIKPDINYQAKKSQALIDKLNMYSAALDQDQINQLTKETEEFYSWQNTPDTKENLAMFPTLKVEDISTQKKEIEISEPINIEDVEIIQTYIDTQGISNIVLSFDATKIPQKNLQYLQLIGTLLGAAATKNYSKSDLTLQQLNYLGEFNPVLSVMSNDVNYYPKFNISIKTLTSNEKQALELVNEIINNSIFDDKQLVRKSLQQFKLYYEQSLNELSVPLANDLSEAMTSEKGKLKDYIEGYEFYNFVTDTLNRLDKNWNSILKELEETKNLIFNKSNLTIGYTNTKDKQYSFIKNITPIINKLPDYKGKSQKYKFKEYGDTIAVLAPTNTLSVNEIGNLNQLGYKYNGNMAVLSTIVSKNYLWDYIREQGGAYHTSMNIHSDGFIRLLSYADPNFIKTIKVYQNIPIFLKNIVSIDQSELDSYIINSAAYIDNSLQDYNLWNYGLNNYLTGYSLDKIYTQKEQILNTTVKDIAEYSRMFEKLNSKGKYMVIGNSEIINQNKNLFDTIITEIK